MSRTNLSLSALSKNHIKLSSGSPIHNLVPGDNPWKSPDRLEELNALCPFSTLQPLSLEYQVNYYPYILPWLHHWTSLTGLKLNISSPFSDILTNLNQSLTCLTQLRFLIVKLKCKPGKLDLVGLNQLESLEVNADHLDLNCLTTLNLKHLKIDFYEESRCQPFPHLTSLIALEVLVHFTNPDLSELIGTLCHLPELRQLRLFNLKSNWMCHLADMMPPNLVELTLIGYKFRSPDTLDAILFSLPVDLHKFENDLPIWEAPKFVKWMDSWSGAFRQSPLALYQPEDEAFQCLVNAYIKCTHMTNIKLNLFGIGRESFDSIEYLFANATQFRELDLRFSYPDEVMMTTLSAVTKHVAHLNKLTIGFSAIHVASEFPKAFFQLWFPELQEFTLQDGKFQYDQWPLLRGFLEVHSQLKSVNVALSASETKEAAQLLWSLFPLTLESIHVQTFSTHGDELPFLEALPDFLGQSCWHSLTILLYSSLPSDFTLPPTALWIQNLNVFQKKLRSSHRELLKLPDTIESMLAANRKRHESLESLLTPQQPYWCDSG